MSVGCSRTIQDPACQRLNWYKPPLTVLVIKKIFDDSIRQSYIDLIIWLIKVRRQVTGRPGGRFNNVVNFVKSS